MTSGVPFRGAPFLSICEQFVRRMEGVSSIHLFLNRNLEAHFPFRKYLLTDCDQAKHRVSTDN